MIAVLKQLATCTRYLFVRSAKIGDKRLIDIYLPVIFAVISCFIVSVRPRLLPLLGEHGLLAHVNGLLQVLVGFFVASLAAVATFPNPSMAQDAKNLSLRSKSLSRREFLASIFGYLALIGLALYLLGVFSDIFLVLLKSPDHTVFRFLARVILSFTYFLMLWQMFFVMFLGIHYLVDRIHRTD